MVEALLDLLENAGTSKEPLTGLMTAVPVTVPGGSQPE
jgi:hypothetical protein